MAERLPVLRCPQLVGERAVMARIRLPQRPNPSRIQAARVAAARVATASTKQVVMEEIETVAGGIPDDYLGDIAEIRGRLDALEGS